MCMITTHLKGLGAYYNLNKKQIIDYSQDYVHDHTHVEGHGSSSLLELEQKQLIYPQNHVKSVFFLGEFPLFFWISEI